MMIPAPVRPLLGCFEGPGEGSYPTIAAFSFHERVCFTDVGKPFIVYEQTTTGADGAPLHRECGYLRVLQGESEGDVELVLAQPTGHTELLTGSISDTADALVVDFTDAQVTCSPSAKEVSTTRRRWVLRGDCLQCTFSMAAVGQPLQQHLASTLQRVTD